MPSGGGVHSIIFTPPLTLHLASQSSDEPGTMTWTKLPLTSSLAATPRPGLRPQCRTTAPPSRCRSESPRTIARPARGRCARLRMTEGGAWQSALPAPLRDLDSVGMMIPMSPIPRRGRTVTPRPRTDGLGIRAAGSWFPQPPRRDVRMKTLRLSWGPETRRGGRAHRGNTGAGHGRRTTAGARPTETPVRADTQ